MAQPRKKSPAPARKASRNRSFVGLIGILVVAGVAVIGYLVSRPTPTITPRDPNAPLPPARGYVMGSASAPVEIMEYGDFECPRCGEFTTITEPDVRTKLVNTGLARFQFLDFPIPSAHGNTMVAHNAAACAGAQNKFWEMHDKLFENQPYWSILVNGKDSKNPAKAMKGYAKDIGIEMSAFNTCFDTHALEGQIIANQQAGAARGVDGTPAFFIGKHSYPGKIPWDVLKAMVDSATAEAKAAPPAKDPPQTKAVSADTPSTKTVPATKQPPAKKGG